MHLALGDRWPLAGAVLTGGVAGPLLLMVGLTQLPATGASLLLNAEGVFTALLAWFVFKENPNRRVVAGMVVIGAGAVVLTAAGGVSTGSILAVPGDPGCLRLLGPGQQPDRARCAVHDASWLAALKGLVAGPVNLALAFALGASIPPALNIASAMIVGLFAYGVSLVLFIVGMRHVGTARAGAYFSVAPFFGAALAVVLGEALTWPLIIAGGLMALGVWLHLRERHEHPHTHPLAAHEHWHTHDEHHQHGHLEPVAPGVRHQHLHTHQVLTHTHEHYPDSHHRHRH